MKVSNKMNPKQMEIGFITICLTILAVIVVSLYEPSQIEKDVISGNRTLTCEFSDGWKTISKDKILNFNDENGYWTFTNGYARNCIVQ